MISFQRNVDQVLGTQNHFIPKEEKYFRRSLEAPTKYFLRAVLKENKYFR